MGRSTAKELALGKDEMGSAIAAVETCLRACSCVRARARACMCGARAHARIQLMGKELLALFRYSD